MKTIVELPKTKSGRGGARSGAGRPKTGNPPRRAHAFEFTEAEWDAIREKSKRKGLSARAYISYLVEQDK